MSLTTNQNELRWPLTSVKEGAVLPLRRCPLWLHVLVLITCGNGDASAGAQLLSSRRKLEGCRSNLTLSAGAGGRSKFLHGWCKSNLIWMYIVFGFYTCDLNY
ncbi:hypothetical protein F2P79_005356 [Pimephales promelas]|nr:hypothetical protein F2P79_005356 [Pimephales promelas]